MKSLRILAVLIACYGLSASAATGQNTPVIKFREGRVWVTGLQAITPSTNFNFVKEDQWASILRIYTHDAFLKKMNQPMAGTYAWHGDSLSFTPGFSFAAGQPYHAVFDCQTLNILAGSKQANTVKILEHSFSIPKENRTSTFVETVYPQADVLPENMLRMYISFSGPMMSGEAYEHITLVREDGTPIEKAFLVIDQELWDAERKRFTLLFDPGRIKRGIQSQLDLGTPLQASQTYRLIIDSTWRDVHGNPLAGSYSKVFTVTSAERSTLNIQHWKITAPTAGTKDELMIMFDRPVDYVLALKHIAITTTQAGNVSGQILFTHSRYWRFIPDQAWAEDQYVVEVNPELEDVAGNNLNNTFDIDLHNAKRISTTEIVRRYFSIKPLMK